jgi:hypothetical protein
MNKKFLKVAQEAPAPPADMGGGGEAPPPMDFGGGAPMDFGMPPMPGAPPTAPASNAPFSNTTPILYPLDNLGAILSDAPIGLLIKNNLSQTDVKLANKIWQLYGGDEFGGAISSHAGKREPGEEVDPSELERTENRRWERLPKGQTIKDISNLEDFVLAVRNFSLGITKQESASEKGGGGMGLASRKLDDMIKLAYQLDSIGEYKLADKLFKI